MKTLSQDALEIAMETGDMTSRVLGLVAGVLDEAAIELNNSAMGYPEAEWRQVCDRVAWLNRMSAAYAECALNVDDHEAAFADPKA